MITALLSFNLLFNPENFWTPPDNCLCNNFTLYS